MDIKRMHKYYETFNTCDLEALEDFYTEDLTLDYQTITIKGRKAILDYFKDYFNAVKEKITPLQIFIDGDNIAVEISDELTAKVDIPDLMGTPVKANESIVVKFGAFYDARGDKICRIRLYG